MRNPGRIFQKPGPAQSSGAALFLPLLRLLLLLAPLVLLGGCGQGERMRARLAGLERQNRADSLMTNDSLTLSLASWFDRHGTPNERLRAHYILGRTYADLGEAPAALDAYLDAAECADTTREDCDYYTLSRVYGQMSEVFYNQNLMHDYLHSLNRSVVYAWRAKDTLQALNEYAHMIAGYDNLQCFDKVASMFDEVYRQFHHYFGLQIASRYCTLPVRALLKKGQASRAMYYLDIYRAESGYFGIDGSIEEGREVYYYLRGLCYYYLHQYDSAVYYFQKELHDGLDYDNQSMATRGLSLVYLQMDMPDSAAKYAIQSYEMNDSAYAQMAIREVEQVSAQNNYTRHQRIAYQEHLKARQEREKNTYLSIIAFAIFLLLCSSFLYWKRKQREMMVVYKEKKEELTRVCKEMVFLQKQKVSYEEQINEKEELIGQQKAELLLLREHETEYENLVCRKQAVIEQKGLEISELHQQKDQLLVQMSENSAVIERLKADIEEHQRKFQGVQKTAENLLEESPVYQKLKKKQYKPSVLTTAEWEQLESMLEEIFPGFYTTFSSKKFTFTESEYKICLLFRLHIKMKATAAFLGIAKSQVSTISRGILTREFGVDGSGKELKRRLESIF